MHFGSVSLILLFMRLSASDNVTIRSRTVTSLLEPYEAYKDTVMIHLKVPQDTLYASFKFKADETQMSIFGCSVRNVSLYLKQGAPPVINPDGSTFPKTFKNITRCQLFNLEIKTDNKESYINISSPEPGTYYAATFLSYSDPKYNAIQQEGLRPSCYANLEATLYTKKIEDALIVAEDSLIQVILTSTESRYFKFFVPSMDDHGLVRLKDIYLPENNQLVLRMDSNKPPTPEIHQIEQIFQETANISTVSFQAVPDSWHYIELKLTENVTHKQNSSCNLFLTVSLFTYEVVEELSDDELLNNQTFFNNSITKTFHSSKITDLITYKQYDLIREASSDSFVFSYELEEEFNSKIAVPINMTNTHFSLLKFKIREGTDVGGTLQFVIAFKPRIRRSGSTVILEPQPENQVIVACIRKGVIEVPTWPNGCVSNGVEKPAQLILNKTIDNSTILIPYPESGMWYATFKLFCGLCVPCNCPQHCQEQYENCTKHCDLNCVIEGNCDHCSSNCSKQIIGSERCSGCNCDGPCLKNESVTCNSSILFDIGSHPCIFGQCSRNGRCMYMVSDGVVFSTCVCMNKYRGWDCSDDSQATPYYMVAIELVLLVLSNLLFLPAVYVAFKRKFIIEAICYFAICFFSTFYHACDAGENILSFCLVRLSALQFGDFFCALLAIWVTLIAIADLSELRTSVFHMAGAIILAFCTTINKTALWIFTLPVFSGLLIIAVSWFLKYRIVRSKFANRRYLYYNIPIGAGVVAVGLVMYAFLQTKDNYKYLHSLWHAIMAIALVIVLPEPNTFLPEVLL